MKIVHWRNGRFWHFLKQLLFSSIAIYSRPKPYFRRIQIFTGKFVENKNIVKKRKCSHDLKQLCRIQWGKKTME